MAEYIKKSYAIDAVLDVYYDTPDIDLSGEKFEEAIRKIQAADVAPVRHGRWEKSVVIQTDTSTLYDYTCSECSIVTTCESDFCPNCGAKMDLNDLED